MKVNPYFPSCIQKDCIRIGVLRFRVNSIGIGD